MSFEVEDDFLLLVLVRPSRGEVLLDLLLIGVEEIVKVVKMEAAWVAVTTL